MHGRLAGLFCAVLLLAPLTSSRPARAESGDAVTRARTHFEAGRALYNLGNYTDSIREFSAGYQLVPKPQFLINLGQAYRKLGDLEKARDMYRRFLDETPPSDPDREQARQVLVDLERMLADRPPIAAPKASPASIAPRPTAPVPPAEAVVAQPAAVPKKSFIRRHWWIIPVSAVVLAGVGVGIYFAVRPTGGVDCSTATLGCIDAVGLLP